MKTKLKFRKILALVMSLMMIISVVPVAMAEGENVLSVGDNTVSSEVVAEGALYKFTPQVKGEYTFVSQTVYNEADETHIDPEGKLLNAGFDTLVGDSDVDADNDNYNFSLTYELEAETVYYLCITFRKAVTYGVKVVLGAHEHKFGEYSEKTPATCTANRIDEAKCLYCDETDEKEVENTAGHDMEWTDNEDKTHSGQCKNCEYKVESEDHTFKFTEDFKEATCTEQGLKKYNCEKCGALKTETVEALNHKNAQKVEAKKAGCTTDGNIEYYYCPDCEKYSKNVDFTDITTAEAVIIERTGHKFEVISIDVNCEVGGKKLVKCAVCEHEEEQEVLPGHDLVEIKSIHEQDEPTIGYKCANCKKYFLDEEAENEITDNAKIAEINGKASHTAAAITPAKDATCTENGNSAYYKCTFESCGRMFSDEKCENEVTAEDVNIPALGHILVLVPEKEGNCTEAGNKAYYKCTREGCTAMFEDAEGKTPVTAEDVDTGINPTAHHYKKQEYKAATCTTDGYTTYLCEYCGVDSYTETHKATGHAEGEIINTNATCTEDGYKRVVCPKCKQDLEEAVKIADKLGHDYGNWSVVKEAGCTDAGSRERTCKREDCGYTDSEVIDPLGHDWDVTSIKVATCTVDGENAKKCKRCLKEETEKVPAAHKYGEWQFTSEVTCEKDGAKERICSECKKKETEIVKATGHEWTDWQRTGNIKYRMCTVCYNTEQKEAELSEAVTVKDNATGISVSYYDDVDTYKSKPTLVISSASTDNKNISEAYKQRAAWNIATVIGEESVQPGEPVTVTIPLPEGFNVNSTLIYAVDDKGNVERVYGVEISGTSLLFETSELGTYLVVDEGNSVIEEECDCICHYENSVYSGLGAFLRKIIYKFLSFFWKLTNTNQICKCGAVHYTVDA